MESLWHCGKKPTCQCKRHKRHGFDPWVGKIPWRRKWQPTPVFLPGKSHGQRNLVCCSPWECKRVGHDLVTKHQLEVDKEVERKEKSGPSQSACCIHPGPGIWFCLEVTAMLAFQGAVSPAPHLWDVWGLDFASVVTHVPLRITILMILRNGHHPLPCRASPSRYQGAHLGTSVDSELIWS